MRFQHAVQWGRNALGIIAQIAEIITNERKLRLGRVYPLDQADTFDGLVLKNIAAEAINGILRVNDQAPIPQTFDDGLNIPGLRVIGMEMQ